MPSFAENMDFGAEIAARQALPPATVTAGTGADGTLVNGTVINRLQKPADLQGALPQLFKSGALVITGVVNVSGSDTVTIEADIQDDAVVGMNGTPAVLASGSIVVDADGEFALVIPVNFEDSRQFIRARVTPTLSAGATDTVQYQATLIAGRGRKSPAVGAAE